MKVVSRLLTIGFFALLPAISRAGETPEENGLFSRHVAAVFSKLGCNGGGCHGAVKGQNGFRLTLFGADPALDHERLVRELGGRRLNLEAPEQSLLLLKGTGQASHVGGKRMEAGSPEYEIVRRWIARGAKLDAPEESRVTKLQITPAEHACKPGETYRLRVEAHFANGSSEVVTGLCSFESTDRHVATISRDGEVQVHASGHAAFVVRYIAEPAIALLLVPRPGAEPFPDTKPVNLIDAHILAKLRRLNIPPSGLADDVTFLRRVTLDTVGELPAPQEIKAFIADARPEKRARKIDELLNRPGYAALWSMKFCDLLKANDYYQPSHGISQEQDLPRLVSWVRARLEENTPYDQFVERILTATSRDDDTLEEWAKKAAAISDGYATPRSDLKLYSERKTLDLYWQRPLASSVAGTLQIAHAFLGLRLECAQCHRHPNDVWQQDDLLSFANFFMRVRQPAYEQHNDKKFPEQGAIAKKFEAEAKSLAEQAKKLKSGGKDLDAAAKKSNMEMATRLERRGYSRTALAQRILHADVHHIVGKDKFAKVTSPLGTQESRRFRLLGETKAIDVAPDQDPRPVVVAWMRRPDNPYFAKAIVNRVWAHYFGRGIIEPADHLSPLNPPSHPELLDELCREFIAHAYDLKWLHRTIMQSDAYQRSSQATPANALDRSNYAAFYYRRLPAEVLLDALSQATGTTEDLGMRYYHWPPEWKTVEAPYPSKNVFVNFMLEQFGRPQRNSASQCDCERDGSTSVLQVLSFASHPRIRQRIADKKGQVAKILSEHADNGRRVEEIFLCVLCRSPNDEERTASLKYVADSTSPAEGFQGLMWSLLNTREFLLQH